MMKTKSSYMSQPSPTLECATGRFEPGLFGQATPSIPRPPFEHVHGNVEVPGTKEPVAYTLALPTEPQSDLTALIVPGYGAFKRTSRGLRDNLAAHEGIAALSYDPARVRAKRSDVLRDLFDPQALHLHTVEAIVEDLEQKQLLVAGRLALLAHSMGSLAGSDFADRHPEKLAGIVYLGPVGLGSPGLQMLIGRGLQEFGTDVLPAIARGQFSYSPTIGKRAVAYFMRNPVRSASEVISCGEAGQVMPARLAYIARMGIPQAIVSFQNDKFFPTVETRQAAGELVDVMIDLENSSHAAPQTEARRVATVSGALLKRLCLESV